MNNQKLTDLIQEFHPDKIIPFINEKNSAVKRLREFLDRFNDEDFSEGIKLGEITFSVHESMIICTLKANKALSERSGKKAQYEKAKRILDDFQADAGIFVFYDQLGNFRFSLVYTNYLGKKRDWSSFRRFTYFVSPDLTNKTFLDRIGKGDFSNLEAIKESFSVEKVTKDFYQEISYWYFWAVQKCKFPKDAELEENGRNISVIRLITRMIFIWFMRERGLVPKELFSQEFINENLKDHSVDSSSYYQAILQNLFFATLSTKKSERVFRNSFRAKNGFNPDYGNQFVYRFIDYFEQPELIQSIFKDIPFLNGGLFDCLDDKETGIYIDGFSEIKKYQPYVPNFLFFSDSEKIDINAELGTNKSNYNVRGLLKILSAFNFTIDENTLDDQEVALDPELLGRVFENLLASFNPETASTARKATGSYYTPREIVEYMVDESLKGYLSTHLQDIEDLETKLNQLFSSTDETNPFDESQSKKIVHLIESIRIVDPAVGSGAFPMGILNKLVFLLHKVDNDNKFWEQAQIDVADTIPEFRLRKEAKKRIALFFKEKNADYGRKLFLIQKCIYGVDIQQIAVEIAKLRFFISLLVDEKIDHEKENCGVEPLPNLDFKIMQGNSLISEFLGVKFETKMNEPTGQISIAFVQEKDQLIRDFEHKKIQFQNESDKEEKSRLIKEIEDLIIKIFENVARIQKEVYFNSIVDIKRKYSVLPNKKDVEELVAKEIEKVNKRFGFNLDSAERKLREYSGKNKTRPFFLWQLYFAEVFKEKGGFDVVIGNPPYVSAVQGARTASDQREIYKNNYPLLSGSFDLYSVFVLLGVDLISKLGLYAWILPNKFLISGYSSKIRKSLLSKGLISSIDVSFSNVFDNGVYPIIIFGRINGKKKFIQYSVKNLNDLLMHNLQIIKKTNKSYKTLVDFGIKINSGTTGFQAHSIKKLISDTPTQNSIPFIVSGCVDRYKFSNTNVRYMGHLYNQAFIKEGKEIAESKWNFWQNEKIVVAGMTKNIEAVYCDTPLGLGVGIYGIYDFGEFLPKFMLGVLNSKFISYYLITEFMDKHLAGGYIAINKSTIEKLPFVKVSINTQKIVSNLVDQILNRMEANPSGNTYDLENQIDQIVYEMFGLNKAEIELIERVVNFD